MAPFRPFSTSSLRLLLYRSVCLLEFCDHAIRLVALSFRNPSEQGKRIRTFSLSLLSFTLSLLETTRNAFHRSFKRTRKCFYHYRRSQTATTTTIFFLFVRIHRRTFESFWRTQEIPSNPSHYRSRRAVRQVCQIEGDLGFTEGRGRRGVEGSRNSW